MESNEPADVIELKPKNGKNVIKFCAFLVLVFTMAGVVFTFTFAVSGLVKAILGL
jgi:hypothetical protein